MPPRTQPDLRHEPELPQPGHAGLGQILWLLGLAATLVVLAIGFRAAIFTSPTEGNMGNIARVIYYHVPTAMLSLVFPYINLAASIVFLGLRHRNPLSALAADALALASAEVTLLYTGLALATGMLWGRVAWGIWWTWDARLTLQLLLLLLYISYLMTRRLSAAGQTSTLSAVLAIFAAVDIPINYMSIRWWRTQHPAPVFGGGSDSGLDKTMMPAFLWNVVAWSMWGIVILVFRYALERRRQAAEQDAALAAIESSMHTHFDSSNSQGLDKEPPHAR
jgi:heme exporter protein C